MTRARRDQQWREQAARLIAAACWPGSEHRQVAVRNGHAFDVAEVRAYCEHLISEADALDVEREVFADWTRARGFGPENRDRGAFVVACSECHGRPLPVAGELQQLLTSLAIASPKPSPSPATLRSLRTQITLVLARHDIHATPELSFDPETRNVVVRGLDDALRCSVCGGAGAQRGGWPGKLAREYAAEQRSRRRCPRKDCDGGVLVGDFADVAASEIGTRGRVTFTDDMLGDAHVNCPECEAFNATRTSRAFANGGNLRRAARRLLDTLDGRCPWNIDAEAQPSECASCDGRGRGYSTRYYAGPLSYIDVPGRGLSASERTCAKCNGTGHNLRGVLPPLPEGTERKLAGRSIVRFDDLRDAIERHLTPTGRMSAPSPRFQNIPYVTGPESEDP